MVQEQHQILIQLPLFKIDLDLPPIQRWKEVCSVYKQQLQNFIAFIKKEENIKKYSKEMLKLIQEEGKNYDYCGFKENNDALATLLEIPVQDLLLLNFQYDIDNQAYELSHECTAIVTRNKKNQVFVCRNWDYFWAQKQLQDIQVQYDFYSKGIKIASSITPACTIIPHTGIRYGKFALSFNLRIDGKKEANVPYLLHKQGYVQAKYLLMLTVITDDSYNEAVKRLTEANTSAPCFYTLGGVNGNEGQIIEKAREGIYKKYELDNNTWFHVISNTDTDKSNLQKDPRRCKAVDNMNKLGQTSNQDFTIFDVKSQVLDQEPTFSKDTILQIIMSAESNQIHISKKKFD